MRCYNTEWRFIECAKYGWDIAMHTFQDVQP